MKKKIVIASTLKPIRDVRAYWKFAQSLVKTNKGKYEIHILGNSSKKELDAHGQDPIYFHPHRLQADAYLKRVLISVRILAKVLRLKPDLLIINTHELLHIVWIVKKILGCSVLYDVQENYSANATLNSGFLGVLKRWGIKLQEGTFTSSVDHFFLAESCYKKELNYLKNNFTILENKALEIYSQPSKTREPIILFSGTLSRYSGVDIAIKVMDVFLKNHPKWRAIIIGQIHDKQLLSELEHAASQIQRIQLVHSFYPIEYEEILNAIQSASLGIISYLENNINLNKVPTKLYEYSRYGLPYLIQENTKWVDLGAQLGGCIAIDLINPDIEFIDAKLADKNHLFPDNYPKEATWESESKNLLNVIKFFDKN